LKDSSDFILANEWSAACMPKLLPINKQKKDLPFSLNPQMPPGSPEIRRTNPVAMGQ
jgi:hypothetical protein